MSALLEGANPRRPGRSESRGRRPRAAAGRGEAGKDLVVHKPDGTIVDAAARRARSSPRPDQPGLYTVDTAGRPAVVRGEPRPAGEQDGAAAGRDPGAVRLPAGEPFAETARPSELRQMYNAELENRQKLWRWLILAAIGVLIVETWLAGRRAAAPRSARAEALAT